MKGEVIQMSSLGLCHHQQKKFIHILKKNQLNLTKIRIHESETEKRQYNEKKEAFDFEIKKKKILILIFF